MKERLINVIKWFLIILGVLFLIQFLLILGAILGLVGFANFDIVSHKQKVNIKPFSNIIKYLDNYNLQNGTYPDNIDSIKKDSRYNYQYQLNKDNNCYTITAKEKNGSRVKKYQQCSQKSSNSQSNSQSFIEYEGELD